LSCGATDVNTGQLDTKAVIQQPAETRNSLGEFQLTWSDWKTRYIALLPLSGTETINALALEATVTHRVRMRYTDGLKPKYRIVAEGRTFEIISVLEKGRRVEHELLVTEVVD
jgi:SPP1 family predicted phage head-tail adaptor